MESHITFNTAKLAKEKHYIDGIKLPKHLGNLGYINCSLSYNEKGELWKRKFYNPENSHYLAPTQSLLQKWLREKHGISVLVFLDCTLSYMWEIKCLHPKASYTGNTLYSLNVWCGDYEACLEDGLVAALKLIKNE